MSPELITYHGTSVSSYTTMMALALFVSVYLAARECEKRRLRLTPIVGLLIFAAGYMGARLLYVIQEEGLSRIWRAAQFWQPGLVFHGGLVAGALVFLVYLRIRRIPLIDALDIAAPYAALGEAIGRVGCLLNGCCWGTATLAPWALTYPPGSIPFTQQLEAGILAAGAQSSLPVHPAPIYLTIGLTLVFVILKRSLDWSAFAGVTILLYALLQGILRFAVEIYRGDVTAILWGLTWGQWISAALVVVSAAMLPLAYRRHQERWTARY